MRSSDAETRDRPVFAAAPAGKVEERACRIEFVYDVRRDHAGDERAVEAAEIFDHRYSALASQVGELLELYGRGKAADRVVLGSTNKAIIPEKKTINIKAIA